MNFPFGPFGQEGEEIASFEPDFPKRDTDHSLLNPVLVADLKEALSKSLIPPDSV